jgi:prophage regulatory protein
LRVFNSDRKGITMKDAVQQGATTLLRMRQVKARTGLSRSTIYLKIKTGEFPAQVSLGPRAMGWLEAEVDRWISSCIERSRSRR